MLLFYVDFFGLSARKLLISRPVAAILYFSKILKKTLKAHLIVGNVIVKYE